ncbi:SET domain-containing protein [Trichinella pseudospiralis]
MLSFPLSVAFVGNFLPDWGSMPCNGLLTWLKTPESECAIVAWLPAMSDHFKFKNILMGPISIHSEHDSAESWPVTHMMKCFCAQRWVCAVEDRRVNYNNDCRKCAIRRGVKIYLINFTEDEISHRLMVVLTVCFNLTKWKSTEIPFFSVNWCCFIEEDVDLSIVFGSGRQPSLRQMLEAK